jgi:hypothetical protein
MDLTKAMRTVSDITRNLYWYYATRSEGRRVCIWVSDDACAWRREKIVSDLRSRRPSDVKVVSDSEAWTHICVNGNNCIWILKNSIDSRARDRLLYDLINGATEADTLRVNCYAESDDSAMRWSARLSRMGVPTHYVVLEAFTTSAQSSPSSPSSPSRPSRPFVERFVFDRRL